METKFTIKEALRVGWEKMKKHFWFFVGLLAVAWIIQSIPSGIATAFQKQEMFALYFLFTLTAWFIQAVVSMGIIKISLDILDREEAQFNTLFSHIHLIWKFFLGSFVYGLIVFAGFLLLIVPGIIWAIKYQFFSYLIIDKNLGPIEAIRKSGEITMGSKGKLFLFGLLSALINLAGLLAFFVGIFATAPTTMMATAYIYRKLMGEMELPMPVSESTNTPQAPQA